MVRRVVVLQLVHSSVLWVNRQGVIGRFSGSGVGSVGDLLRSRARWLIGFSEASPSRSFGSGFLTGFWPVSWLTQGVGRGRPDSPGGVSGSLGWRSTYTRPPAGGTRLESVRVERQVTCGHTHTHTRAPAQVLVGCTAAVQEHLFITYRISAEEQINKL